MKKNHVKLFLIIILLGLSVFYLFRFYLGVQEELSDLEAISEIQKESYEILDRKEVIHPQRKERVYVESRKYHHEDLIRKNPDYAGWLYLPGTKMDYPVTVGDKYIHLSFDGREDLSGNPFIQDGYDARQKYLVIFGHNMGRGSNTMFSPMKDYKDKIFFEQHKDLYFNEIGVTGSKYEIIGFMEYDYKKFDGYDYVKTDFADERAFEEYKENTMKKMSHYTEKFKNLTFNEDRLLILSTCDTDFLGRTDWKRLVLYAVKVS